MAQLAVHGRQALSSSYQSIEAQSGELGTLDCYLAGRAQQHGLITRAMGDTIARCPPQIRRSARTSCYGKMATLATAATAFL